MLMIMVLGIMLGAGCVTTTKTISTPQSNYAYHYNPTKNNLNPQYLMVKTSEDEMRLYMKINTKGLRFSKANNSKEYKAELRFTYMLVPSFTDRTVVDSASNIIRAKYLNRQNQLVTYFNLKPGELDNFVVYIKVTDVLSGYQSRNFIRGINTKNETLYDYLFKDVSGRPLFKPFANIGDAIMVKKLNSQNDKIFIKYYNNKFQPAYAPFNTEQQGNFEPAPTKIYSLKNSQFVAKKPGLYLFTSDTSKTGGALLYVGNKYFPRLNKSLQLIETLKYITKPDEYDTIISAKNKKLELDKFWLKAAGNRNKAAQLIKVWYTRAKYANYFFTSYKEGWKTDRGMIYILFGPPDILNYNDQGERWGYRGKSNELKIFQFKIANPETSRTDYVLTRKLSYANLWYFAAESWRNGKIYE